MSAPVDLAGRNAPAAAAGAIGCVVLFLLPFAAVGAVTAVLAARAFHAGDWKQAGFLGLFALTFGGVGFGGIAVALSGRRRVAERLAREERYADAPWLWREDWAARRVNDSSRPEMWNAWVFAALWNLVSLPGAVLATRSALQGGNRAALLALLFPVAGVGILAWAVRASLRYRRYGTSRLELATPPAIVGHTLEGTVRTPSDLRPAGGFRVVLSCIRRETTGSGRDRSTWEHVLWQEERRAAGGASGVPVAFTIPRDAVPCEARTSGDGVFWRLDVTGEVPGVDYAAAFEVPVFRTAASDAPLSDADRVAEAAAAVPADYRQPAGSRIRVSTTPRGVEIYFPPARNPGFAVGLTMFLAIWLGAVVLMVTLGAPIIFPVLFGGFSVLFTLLVADVWLAVTRVTAGRDGVTVATGWLVPQRERTVRAAEVADVTVRITAQAGTTPYYDVTIETRSGKRVTAGGGVRDKREAEWLAARLEAAIGAARV